MVAALFSITRRIFLSTIMVPVCPALCYVTRILIMLRLRTVPIMLAILHPRVARTPVCRTSFICGICHSRLQFLMVMGWSEPAPGLNTTITFRIRAIFTMHWLLVMELSVYAMGRRIVQRDQTSPIRITCLAETQRKQLTIFLIQVAMAL